MSFEKTTLKKKHLLLVAIVLCFSSAWALLSTLEDEASPSKSLENARYLNPKLTTEARITNLISYMTIEEKVGQMALVEKNSIQNIDDIATYGLGALLSGFGAKPENNTPEGWSTMVSDFIQASKKSRLSIPILYGVDAIHGHTNVPGATVFPHFIGLGATKNPDLVEAVARATAEELKATSINWNFSPTLDMPHDIRWGRTYETFSDDPTLVARLGTAYLNGLQKNGTSSASSLFIMGTPKHFVGAGGMVWGSSSNGNFKIDQGTTPPEQNILRMEYLIPFKAVVDTRTRVVNARARSVMVGLNSWGETKLSESKYLITNILKGGLGFDGFAVSDWYGVYEISGSEYYAAVSAINAGIDMVMLPFDYKSFIQNVVQAVENGDIRESRIDDAVRRILRAKFALGFFDKGNEGVETSREVIGSEAHRTLAREAVAQSLVLLKNEESVLPLQGNVSHIRVAGSAAHNVGRQAGAWTVEWQGVEGNVLAGATSILDGIRARVGTSTKVEYDVLGNFSLKGASADVGIAIVGEKPYAEGWGDREYPTLDPEDLAAIKKLHATCKKVVVIIVSGRPLLITNEISTWDALVEAWLPGSEGEGVADVLFGDTPFVGTLPLPWPHHSEQLPIDTNGVTADKTPVLFPRDFGLRYSTIPAKEGF
ncbi:MAG: glycoside hydrolase family 3 protein [Minisyncoccia bacterium]